MEKIETCGQSPGQRITPHAWADPPVLLMTVQWCSRAYARAASIDLFGCRSPATLTLYNRPVDSCQHTAAHCSRLRLFLSFARLCCRLKPGEASGVEEAWVAPVWVVGRCASIVLRSRSTSACARASSASARTRSCARTSARPTITRTESRGPGARKARLSGASRAVRRARSGSRLRQQSQREVGREPAFVASGRPSAALGEQGERVGRREHREGVGGLRGGQAFA